MNGNKSLLYKTWIGVLSTLLLLGFVAIFKILTKGQGAVFHADDHIPWTLLIAAYIFFVLTSSGATLVSTLPLVFGFKEYYPIAKRSVFIALCSLIAGFVAIGLELGNPINMYYYFLHPNPLSPIWWMGLFYSLFLALLLIKFWRMHIGDWDSKLSKLVTIGALIFEIGALSTLGLVFGLIEARPTFFGEFIPVYFLSTAILSGLSAVILISLVYFRVTNKTLSDNDNFIFNNLSKILALTLFITILLSVWRAITGLYANRPEFSVVEYMITSLPYRIELLFGLIIPFSILIVKNLRESWNGKIISTVLVIMGLGIGRMDMIMTGQIIPIMPKTTVDIEVLKYFPTIWEWIIGLFAFAIMFLLYTMGEKYFNLDAQPTK